MPRSHVVYVVRHGQEIVAVFTVKHEMFTWSVKQLCAGGSPFANEYRMFAIPNGMGEQAAREVFLNDNH